MTHWDSAAVARYGWSEAEAVGSHIALLTIPRLQRDQSAAVLQTLRDDDRDLRSELQGEIAARLEASTQSPNRESRWQSLNSHSAEASVFVDADTGLITWASSAVTRLSGWLPEELAGKSARSPVHPEDAHLLAGALHEVIADPKANATVDLRMLNPDGSYRWVEGAIRNLVDEPGVNGLVANLRDHHRQTHGGRGAACF